VFLFFFVDLAQTIEEFLRAEERRRPGFLRNTRNWIETAFVVAKQFGGGCVCGFADGTMDGFRSNENQTVLRLTGDANGVLRSYRASEFGDPLMLVDVEFGFNVTKTEWFMGAEARAGFFQTNLRVFAGTEGVGFTYAIALMEDLMPPVFASGRAPLAPRASSAARRALAVCGVDGKLSDLSRRLSLRKIGTSGRAIVFFFTVCFVWIAHFFLFVCLFRSFYLFRMKAGLLELVTLLFRFDLKLEILLAPFM
jgi:hypothetical protein